MQELFMQIEIKDIKLNTVTCFDNITSITVSENFLFIKDKDFWSTSIKIYEDIEIKVNFYNLEQEFEF